MRRNVLRSLFAVLLGILISFVLVRGISGNLGKERHAVLGCDSHERDLGIVPLEQPMNVKFGLENLGQTPIEIKVERTSCTCSAAVLSNAVLNPGIQGSLLVRVDARLIEGPFDVQVFLTAKSESGEEHVFTIRGEARKVFRMIPRLVNFQDVSVGQLPKSMDIEITALEPPYTSEISRLQVEFAPFDFDATVARIGESSAVVRVTMRNTVPIGGVHDDLLLRFPGMKDYRMAIPIIGRVLGGVSFEPDMIFISESTQEAGREVVATLKGLSQDGAIVSVEGSGDFFQDVKVGQEVVAGLPAVSLRVEGGAKKLKGSTGHVDVKFTSKVPGEGVIRLPVVVQGNTGEASN